METMEQQDGLCLWYQWTEPSHLLGLYFICSVLSDCLIGFLFCRLPFSFSLYEPKRELDYEELDCEKLDYEELGYEELG
jgi:hypothetical protein